MNSDFTYICIAVFTILFTISLYYSSMNTSFEKAFRDSLYSNWYPLLPQQDSLLHDYLEWKGFVWFIFFLLMFTGGCIGSTGGGIKMIRHLTASSEIQFSGIQKTHPSRCRATNQTRWKNHSVPEIIYNFLAFFLCIYHSIYGRRCNNGNARA
jgi:trk system potassium uptake protein